MRKIVWLVLLLPMLLMANSALAENLGGAKTTPESDDSPVAVPDHRQAHRLAFIAQSSRDKAAVMGTGDTRLDLQALFTQQVVRIPMRDGVELHTEIYTPRGIQQALPIILTRSPYGQFPDQNGYAKRLHMYPKLIEDGYIFVFQDTRGRGTSNGKFVSLGPVRDRSVPGSTDESTDTWDTIDWLVKQVAHNNGRVGTLGISYGGFLTTRALIDPHPALKAASPQASCADMFVGDDWHHNGAFRLEYTFDWLTMMERGGAGRGGAYDNYDFFLGLGPLSNINRQIFHGQSPSWNAFVEHPDMDDYWRYGMCGVLPYIQPVKVPTLSVAGWFDAEDFYGPLEIYKKFEEQDPHNLSHLVIGPWWHAGWSLSPEGRAMGPVDFGSNTTQWFRGTVMAPWFAHWLKDAPKVNLPEVWAFRTGANQWEAYDQWPPTQGITQKSLYLHAGGGLSFTPPPQGEAARPDEYVSDPAKPVPYRMRPIRDNGWPEWQLEDQRLADGRPDVLTYVSEPLAEDLSFTGEPVAHLFAATTGSDSDWVVKLIDVYPEDYPPDPSVGGFQFMIAGEVFRARYRNSFEHPEAVIPGEVTGYEINLRSRSHTFKAGHRMMVQIQSTWFPLIDRNPQKFVESIYAASEEDFQKATQSIYGSAHFPSHISLPVSE